MGTRKQPATDLSGRGTALTRGAGLFSMCGSAAWARAMGTRKQPATDLSGRGTAPKRGAGLFSMCGSAAWARAMGTRKQPATDLSGRGTALTRGAGNCATATTRLRRADGPSPWRSSSGEPPCGLVAPFPAPLPGRPHRDGGP
ncbi:hypothetical protein Sm713_52450 [Streptomyces sp. TS71-3]|nr:hypothetical protein Sm713_52450 [Streptomyces sp. TS71-3]